jgi:tripartite-type tricarboxylate transporter receptor subunit TctC
MKRRSFGLGLAGVAGSLAWSSQAHAQGGFPSRNISMVVGFTPGGGSDIVARLINTKMGELLGQTVLVENRPGAAGDIAAELVKAAPADGHTIHLIPNSSVIGAAITRRPLRYDIIKDFVPIGLISVVPMVTVVGPQSGINDFRELIALIKSKPGEISMGAAGVGSLGYVTGEWMNAMLGLNILLVPFKGSAQSVQGVASGQINFAFSPLSGVEALAREGKLKMIAAMGEERLPAYPSMPTVNESGAPGVIIDVSYGLVAPAGTPPGVVSRYEQVLKATLADPETAKLMEGRGVPPRWSSGADFGKLMRRDMERWREIGRKYKIATD